MKQLHAFLLLTGVCFATFSQPTFNSFAEAFQLADYLLTGHLPEGNFDEAHKEKIIRKLKESSFSDRAIENFTAIFYYSQELILIGWDHKDICAFFVCSTADVFGYTGSRNDESFTSKEENTRHQLLSAVLFDA